jgi:hypothetical protein
MSEQEFENWLALLSGLLKLSPEQRQNISDELRSHLEERMEDLIDAGSSREEAIAAALAEFGDTAALAHHFTTIAHQKRRRLMRYTYGTIAAVTCAILVLATFWPRPEGPVMPNVVAQSEPTESAESDSAQTTPSDSAQGDQVEAAHSNSFANRREKIEAKLEEPYGAIEFFQMPLREAVADFSTQTGITVVYDPYLIGEQIDPDVPVDLELGANIISAKTLLNDFLIKATIGKDYGYVIRDGYVLITSLENTTEVAVYNCRDLLAPAAVPNEMAGIMGGAAGMAEGYGGEMGYEMMHESGAMGPAMPPPTASDQHLMRVIINTVAPESWIVSGKPVSPEGGTGSIDAINGMIVIKHTREVHEEVQELLKLLREAKKAS